MASSSFFNKFQAPLALIGRILIAALFVPAGIGKITGFSGTVGYIESVMHIPHALAIVGAVVAIVVELGLGLGLLVGFKARWSAFILAIFSVVSAIFFHAYWNMLVDPYNNTQIHFFKNMAIAGGLLAFTVFGPGRLSIEKD
jgi:putative oxidoreductase